MKNKLHVIAGILGMLLGILICYSFIISPNVYIRIGIGLILLSLFTIICKTDNKGNENEM